LKAIVFKSFLVVVAFTVLISNVYCQARNQIFIGARPLGLGESYVSVADDGNATYWNPAGLPTLKRMEFNSMYANLYNIQGLKNFYLSFVYPVSPHYVIGASWFHFGFDDNVLEFFRNKASLSFGAKIYRNLFFGANLKYINTDSRLDGYSEGKADGFGFDLGALYTLLLKNFGLLKGINLGLMAYDVGGTSISYTGTDRSETILPQNIRFGLSFLAKEEISLRMFSLKNALLTADFDDRFHLGTEAWLFDNLGIRGGIQKDFNTDEGMTYSFGGSFKFPYISLQLDYAYVSPPTLSPTHVFSFSFVPSLSPVKITDVSMNDLFASFYKSYATGRIGYVTVRNDYDKGLKLTLKVSIPGLTESETHETFILGPNEKRTSYFPAIFTNTIMAVRGLEIRQARIRIEYKIKNETKYTETNKKFRLLGRGAITWDNPGKAAAFITKLDRMVELFARGVTKDLPYRSEIELGNLYTAAALFNAMGAIGIKYREDPENPFSIIPKTQHSVDRIKYPAELLTEKQGDCDDLTVLYVSLLENSGIRTALVSTEDHIFIMFDTGIHERNWGLLPVGDSLVVMKDKSLWIPVEVTEVGNSFTKAWLSGGKKYRESEHDEYFEVVRVEDVEGLYLSALPEEFQKQIPDLPNKEKLKQICEHDFAWIQNRKMNFVTERFQTKLQQHPDNDRLRNKLGIIFAQQDSIEQAETQFRNILKKQPENFKALTNLANIYLILGKFKDAEKYYLKAAEIKKEEPGLYLNLAILNQLWKIENPADSSKFQTESEHHLLCAFKLLRGDEIKALDLLGILEEEIDLGEKADFKSWVKQKASAIKRFIKSNAKKYIFNKSVKGARLERKAVKRGVDKDRSYILWWAYDEVNK